MENPESDKKISTPRLLLAVGVATGVVAASVLSYSYIRFSQSKAGPSAKQSEDGKKQTELVLQYKRGTGHLGDDDKAEKMFQELEALPSNDGNAQFRMGLARRYGRGVKFDEQAALVHFSKAAEQGHMGAKCMLARGAGKSAKLSDSAVAMLRESARAGVPLAHAFLGDHYLHSQDHDKARVCFNTAAKLGFALAVVALSLVKEKKTGRPPPPAKKLAWLQKAADMGEPRAFHLLAMASYSGSAGKPKDHKRAFELLSLQNIQDSGESLFFRGLFLTNEVSTAVEKDEAEGLRLIKRAVARGCLPAMSYLGKVLLWGRLGLEKNQEEGMRLLQFAADQGEAEAQYFAGLCFQVGKWGLPVDKERAFSLVESAARAGVRDAQHHIAECLFHNKGTLPASVKQSRVRGLQWYIEAARLGHPEGASFVRHLLSASETERSAWEAAIKQLPPLNTTPYSAIH